MKLKMKVIFRTDRMQTRSISDHNLSTRRAIIAHKSISRYIIPADSRQEQLFPFHSFSSPRPSTSYSRHPSPC